MVPRLSCDKNGLHMLRKTPLRMASAFAKDSRDRFRGCLLGLAVGDAFGTTLEFCPPGSFEPLKDMVGGGPFQLVPGQWTDDTSMALCLADSLLEKKKHDPLDQMTKYVRWWRDGYRSSNGKCFDIGKTVYDALVSFEDNPQTAYHGGSRDSDRAGNGSLMRLAPIPMAYAVLERPDVVQWGIEVAGDQSRTTHGSAMAVDACKYYSGLVMGALLGDPKGEVLRPRYHPVSSSGTWTKGELCPEIDEVASGSFFVRSPPEIRGSGWVVRSMEAALWAFSQTDSFKDAIILAANLGEDADTTAAITGMLAGAVYGESNIPESWLDKVTDAKDIRRIADAFHDLTQDGNSSAWPIVEAEKRQGCDSESSRMTQVKNDVTSRDSIEGIVVPPS